MFQSFFMGGFECATHRRRDRLQIDVTSVSRHDKFAVQDYRMLGEFGVRTVRDGLRWHLVEQTPGQYDWSSFLPMLEGAHATGTEVLWDLCHWGVPIGLDIFSAEFPQRFGAFCFAAATLVREFNDRHGNTRPTFYCPVNEISFWAWVGGDVEHFYPYAKDRGPELKRQLVRASLAGIRAVRAADPAARFLQAEPLIQISPARDKPEDAAATAIHTIAQYEAWDMMAGRAAAEMGGSEDCLDVLGVNYYWNNQWIHQGDRTPPGHQQHRPLHQMLFALWERYRRPILISETGCEAGAANGWLGYICAEVRQARRMGAPVLGICLYPVMDYPGWDDDRHCAVGLIEASADWSERRLRRELGEELMLQARLFAD